METVKDSRETLTSKNSDIHNIQKSELPDRHENRSQNQNNLNRIDIETLWKSNDDALPNGKAIYF